MRQEKNPVRGFKIKAGLEDVGPKSYQRSCTTASSRILWQLKLRRPLRMGLDSTNNDSFWRDCYF